MKSIFQFLLIAVTILPLPLFASTQIWELEQNRNGIQVYLKENNQSGIKTFKGVTLINTPIEKVLDIVLDKDACAKWIYQCTNFSIIYNNETDTERYYYFVSDLPFPATNRDFIFRSTLNKDSLSEIYTIKIESVPEYCKNMNSDICQKINASSNIRVKHSSGTYKLEKLNHSLTKVTWEQHTDPAGQLPNWLVNQLIVNIPFNTLSSLKKNIKITSTEPDDL